MTGRTVLFFGLLAAACGRTDPLPFEHRTIDAGGGRCGDGILDPFEDCDDANEREDDACRLTCNLARCGDGVLWIGVEFCDDGNSTAGDGCRADCAPPRCGDGFLDPDEDCDDGNRDNTDDCLATCRRPFCGDRFLRRGIEQCDDGNQITTDACINCVAARCGDGFVQRNVEECDDANSINDDACSNNCRVPFCGDGITAGGEECDLGAGNRDSFAFEIAQSNGFVRGVRVDRTELPSEDFYSYSSASAHTGFERAGESITFLHLDSFRGSLSLFLIHGVDASGSSEPQPDSEVNMRVFGLPPGWFISIADDRPQEFFGISDVEAHGRWRFDNNSDGGVLAGIPLFFFWEITIEPEFAAGIDRWSFIDAGERVQLDSSRRLIIRQNVEPSRCRKDCTVPRCGDGILDAGEFCPDGNF